MFVLGIVGSPRKKGNTSFLVQKALLEAQDLGAITHLIHLCDLNFSDCIGCEGCKDTFKCVIKDDMQKIYPLLLQADAVILGSPTYFYDVTATMKAFLDRCYCYEVFDDDDRSVWMSVNEALGGKHAAVISVCEQTKAEDTGYASKTMRLTLEALGYRVVECMDVINAFKKGEAKSDNEAQNQVKNAARKLVKTMALKQRILTGIKN